METRTVNGRVVTDRRGASEVTGLAYQTIRLYASPTNRAGVGFPEPLTDNLEGREWYPLDELHAYAQRLAQKNAPAGAPAWLRDGDPDDLLPATEFRRAADIGQGTWKRYVQDSRAAWTEGTDGYLPLPDDEEDYRGTGTRYFWKRHRIAHWLDNRPGQTAAGRVGRKPGPPAATVDDAIAAMRQAGGDLSGTQLAAALNIKLPTAYRLLRQARERLDNQ